VTLVAATAIPAAVPGDMDALAGVKEGLGVELATEAFSALYSVFGNSSPYGLHRS
jgi:hypothetical protein